MLQNAQATLNDAVLQHRSRWNINRAALRSDNNNCSLQSDITAEVNRSGDGQVVQLDNARNARDALLEVRDLLEVASQLDDWHSAKAVGVHDQLAVLQTVEIRLDQ